MANEVKLVPLSYVHLEILRNWRNADVIRMQMEYTNRITPEQQVNWFNSLNQGRDYYFIIYYKKEPIGLTHLNQKNTEEQFAHCGLFIAKEEYIGTGISLAASLLLLDLAFQQLNLQYVLAKVKNTNQIAIDYNHKLGFIPHSSASEQFTWYKLNFTEYDARRSQLEELTRYI